MNKMPKDGTSAPNRNRLHRVLEPQESAQLLVKMVRKQRQHWTWNTMRPFQAWMNGDELKIQNSREHVISGTGPLRLVSYLRHVKTCQDGGQLPRAGDRQGTFPYVLGLLASLAEMEDNGGPMAEPQKATLMFVSGSEGRLISWLDNGKAVLVDLDQKHRVSPGQVWEVLLRHFARFAIAMPVRQVAAPAR